MRYVSILLGLVAVIYVTVALDSFWEFNGASFEIAGFVSMLSAIPFIGLIFYMEGFFAENESYGPPH